MVQTFSNPNGYPGRKLLALVNTGAQMTVEKRQSIRA